MIGRKVTVRGRPGIVARWEPLASGMCDALIDHTDGRSCWYASHELRPIDDLGPLPDRHEVRRVADAQALTQLQTIRARHVAGFARPWPGCEHGKTIIGRAVDGALEALEGEAT